MNPARRRYLRKQLEVQVASTAELRAERYVSHFFKVCGRFIDGYDKYRLSKPNRNLEMALHRYGVFDGQPQTYRQIADRYGVSPANVAYKIQRFERYLRHLRYSP